MDPSEAAPDHNEAERTERPRIYVASLSDYNAGLLHGAWIDAAQEENDLYTDVDRMLHSSPTDPQAEEFAVHDYENFGDFRIGEYEPLDWINAVARGITEHGPAYAAWATECHLDVERLLRFEDGYLGEWESVEQYAEEMLDDLGYIEAIEKAVPDSMTAYVKIDYAGFARDLELGGDLSVVRSPDGVWLFDANV